MEIVFEGVDEESVSEGLFLEEGVVFRYIFDINFLFIVFFLIVFYCGEVVFVLYMFDIY